VGVNVTLQTMEWGTFLAKLRTKEQDMFTLSWMAGSEDPDLVMYPLLHSSQWTPVGPNRAMYKNPRFDEVLTQARLTTDHSKRAQLYREAQRLLHADPRRPRRDAGRVAAEPGGRGARAGRRGARRAAPAAVRALDGPRAPGRSRPVHPAAPAGARRGADPLPGHPHPHHHRALPFHRMRHRARGALGGAPAVARGPAQHARLDLRREHAELLARARPHGVLLALARLAPRVRHVRGPRGGRPRRSAEPPGPPRGHARRRVHHHHRAP